MRWETGTAMSGAEEKKAQSGERGPSLEEGRWTLWDRMLIFD